ncbi:glycoside hydrolase 3 protein [Savitreella phatthalungensis]
MLFVISLASLLTTALAASSAGQLGFALGSKRADGTCKNTADYAADLAVLSAHTKLVRIYSVSDCETMKYLMPAAAASSPAVQVMLGVWPTDDAHYNLEKAALRNFTTAQTKSSIHSVTVGSEALYRKDMTATQLASKISEIRTLMSGLGASVPVGTADSWNVLAQGDAYPAIDASDIVLANAFSFWQGQDLQNMTNSVIDDIMQALGVVQLRARVTGSSKLFWVGETGWPTDGNAYDAAKPGLDVAKTYWKDAVCGMLAWGTNVFAFEAFDEPWKPVATGDNGIALPETSWGVFTVDRKLKYNITCPYA